MKAPVAALAAILLTGAASARDPATIYSGGPVVTMAGDTPETVEAIAVRDGRIVAVGTNAAVAKAAGRDARRVDLKGRALLPGFIDAHGHVGFVTPAQLGEMKTLDIQPSFFANHTWYWGDWHRDVALGPKRADFISPQASAWALGLRPTAHNDSPVVEPDIMRLVWSSVNRRTQSGDILGPLERIPVYRALQQVTINAAWQIGEDADKGSLAAGKRGDLVVLDTNPLTADPATLFRIKVVATIKDGKTIYGSLD